MGKAAKQAWKKQQQPTSTYDKQKEAAVPMDPDKHMLVRVADEVNNLSQAVEANKVRSFTGDYEFLSTLHKSRVVLPGEGVTEDDFLGYPTAEHALQAAKTTDAAARDSIRSCKEPLEAKRMGAKIAYDREDWKTRSLAVMEAILRDKFRRHKSLRVSLLETGYKDLVNENDYNDHFWGYVKGKGGSNQLGVLLSKVRADERDGIATLMWAKQIFEAVPDSKVRVDVEVTKDGQRVDAACVSLERRSIITFGKLKENDVPMDHPSISRQHALLVVSSKYGPLLVDLEAPNGTFIDGRRLEPFKGAKLTEEMEVSFGHSTRRYRFHVDSAFDTKKQAKLYEILEDPSKIAAEKGDLGVFVSNLPKDVTEDEVQKFFSNCGTVLQVVLPRNKETKQPRGFAIVIFGTEAAVVNALKLDKDPFRENVIGSDKVHIKRNKPQPKADGGSAGARGGKDGKQEHRRHDQGSAPPASHAPAATREGSRPVSAPPPDGPDPKRNGGDRRSDDQREQQLDRDDRRRGSRVHRDDRDRDRKHSTRSRSRDRRRARSRSHSEERRRSRRHDSSKRDRSRSRDRATRKRSRRQEASSSSSSSSSARSSSSSSSSASSRGR